MAVNTCCARSCGAKQLYMRVNYSSKGFFHYRMLVGSAMVMVTLAIFFIASSFTKRSDRDLRVKETNLIIRQIGHQLLLQAGDPTSRVLPVTETKAGTFLLTFEQAFVFNHDSLMTLAQTMLTKAQFPSGYSVTVHDCTKAAEIVYGFQINNTTPDILACNGRSQPAGCYIIEFAFRDLYESSVNYPLIGLMGGGMMLLSMVAYRMGRWRESAVHLPVQKPDHVAVKDSGAEGTAIGKFLFDSKNQCLLLENTVIRLTDKECRILGLLNANFGALISRETLMQEIWLNEGVITGRSLDMFVSKLRKKLSSDPELKITNIHGKGYRLETQAL